LIAANFAKIIQKLLHPRADGLDRRMRELRGVFQAAHLLDRKPQRRGHATAGFRAFHRVMDELGKLFAGFNALLAKLRHHFHGGDDAETFEHFMESLRFALRFLVALFDHL